MTSLRTRWPLRAASTLVLVVTLAAAAGATYLASRVVDDQEHRLLRERGGEVASVINLAISSSQASLGSLAAVARVTHAQPAPFAEQAQRSLVSKTNPSGYAGLALVKLGATGPRLVTAVGTGVDASRLAEPDVAGALTRTSPTGFLATRVLGTGNNLRLGYVLGAPAAPAGFAVYAEQALSPYASADSPRTSATPFGELGAVIYATPTPDQSQVLVSTQRKLPLQGAVNRQSLQVGPDKWLMVIKARGTLVGRLSQAMPWMLLGLGVALAFVITAVVEVLGRRRSYAEELVAERTRELRASLAELERAQDQLVLSERLAAIGQVASTVGHELRNPLGVISNAVYLLRLRTADAASRRHLDTLDHEVQNAARISSDLLDFARTRTPDWSTVDVGQLVGDSVAVVPPPDGVSVARSGAADVGIVRADRDQLRQVFVNLLSNAYEAVGEHGTVTVTAEPMDSAVRIEVSDTGPGFDETARARLFEPFFTTKTRGTGLGLAVCKRLVEAHSGSLTLVSAPGEGARFVIVIPREPAERSASPSVSAQPAGVAP